MKSQYGGPQQDIPMFQMLKALRGDAGIIECGFVASDVTEAKYFSTPLELGVGLVDR